MYALKSHDRRGHYSQLQKSVSMLAAAVVAATVCVAPALGPIGEVGADLVAGRGRGPPIGCFGCFVASSGRRHAHNSAQHERPRQQFSWHGSLSCQAIPHAVCRRGDLAGLPPGKRGLARQNAHILPLKPRNGHASGNKKPKAAAPPSLGWGGRIRTEGPARRADRLSRSIRLRIPVRERWSSPPRRRYRTRASPNPSIRVSTGSSSGLSGSTTGSIGSSSTPVSSSNSSVSP